MSKYNLPCFISRIRQTLFMFRDQMLSVAPDLKAASASIMKASANQKAMRIKLLIQASKSVGK